MKNESGKHFICLDRADYSNYPNEKEVLLQAGITATVLSVKSELVMADKITIFEVEVSEKDLKDYKTKQYLMMLLPLFMYFISAFFAIDIEDEDEDEHEYNTYFNTDYVYIVL
jgi:hypothetical protein